MSEKEGVALHPRWLAATLLVWVCAGDAAVSTPARADPPPSPGNAEAAERFDRGLRLVDQGDLSGGLAEFQRAYALAPLTVVLYNVGLVLAELGKPVEAARALWQVIAHPEALTPE